MGQLGFGVLGVGVWLAGLSLIGCGSSHGAPAGVGGAAAGASANGAGTAGASTSGGAPSGGANGSGGTGMGGANAGTAGFTLGDTKTEACIAYALASCERQAECSGSEPGNCLRVSFSCPDLVFSAGATRTVADLKACVDAYKKVPCEQLAAGVFPACVTPGTVELGAPCSFSSQCASLSCGGDQDCGMCVVSGHEGDSCANGGLCAGQLLCTDGTCVVPSLTGLAVGQPCSDAARMYCQSGLRCDAATSKCAEYPTLGMSCADTRSCLGDAYCDIDSVICTAFPGEGMPCGVENLNIAGGYCAEPLLCARTSKTVGICRMPPKVGEPCLLDPEFARPEPLPCHAEVRCDATKSPPTCIAKAGQGQACSATSDCASGTSCICPGGEVSCDASVTICGHIQLKGQPCTAPGDVCHPGFSCTAGVCEPRDSQGLFATKCGP